MNISSPLISAWVGRGNFGDELLSYGLRLELNESKSISVVTYYESGGGDVYRSEDDGLVICLNSAEEGLFRRLSRKYLQSYARFDGLFFGGGSVLHSSNSIAWKHDLLRRYKKSQLSSRCFTAAAGVSIGPFPDVLAERNALKFLSELDVVHCRDAASAEFARQLGGKVEVIEGCDLAFSVRNLRPDFFKSEKLQGRVGASFIINPKLSAEQQADQFSKMLVLLNYLTGSGYRVLLASLYSGDKYADNRVHQRLREASRQPELIELHDYIGDVRATVEKISECEFYLSMRLHGIIAAYLSAVPFLALSSHPKVVEFCSGVFGGAERNRCDFSMPVEELLSVLSEGILTADSQPRYEALSDIKYMEASRKLSKMIDEI